MLIGSKGLVVASPYILKKVVDGMAVVGQLDFSGAALGICAFGAARVISEAIN